MNILMTALCLEKAGSHVVALTLASGMAQRHRVYFFNQGEQLVDEGMVKLYLDSKVKLLDMTSFPRLNWVGWKLNGLLSRLGYQGFHERLKTLAMAYATWRYDIDLIHGHEIMTHTARLTTLARWLKVPVVITDHNGYSMLRKVGDNSFIPYANLARAIVAVSRYTADIFLYGNAAEDTAQLRALGQRILATDHKAEYESLRSRAASAPDTALTVPVEVIYNGMQRQPAGLPTGAAVREELGIGADAFVVGMAGRGTEQKGWRTALAAYLQLKQQFPARRFAWLCMGEGACLREIKTELGDSHPDIYLLGSVDNPHYYMETCDVGLVPSSFSEGLPLCVLEFYEHGTPVIGSDLCGIPEVIEPADHAPAGQLIEMDEALVPRVDSLLRHLAAYVTHPDLLRQHGQAARDIRKRFDLEPFVTAHERLYERVLGGKLLSDTARPAAAN
jgi:glycosyltransferase involved in cell wall biosynthesis